MSQRIRIRHPGYKGSNTLFQIPARDGPNHDSAYYTIIHDACCILTGESGTYLTTRDGTRAEADGDGLIQAGIYDVHLPNEDVPDFAIVPNFRGFAFPHDNVPEHWLQVSKDEKRRDLEANFDTVPNLNSEQCRITGWGLIPNGAHIIPDSEKQWFTTNEMDAYGILSGRSGDTVADSPVNKLTLNVFPHQLWDAYHFSIVPRKTDTDEWAWFTQMMRESEELQKHWHS